MFYVYCTLLYAHSTIAIILMGKRELVALLNLSSCCHVIVEWLFLAVSLGWLRFVIVVFPDHTHLLFLICYTDYPFIIIILQVGVYFLTVLVGLFIHGSIVLPLLFFLMTRNNPYKFMYGISQAMATAFGTSSR